MSSTFKKVLGSSILCASIAACAPTGEVVRGHSYQVDLSELKALEEYAPTEVYARPGAPEFDSYRRFIVDPVRVNYDDSEIRELDPESLLELQTYFQKELIRTLKEGGYEVGTRPEPGTLRIALYLSKLKAPNSAVNVLPMAAGLPFVISVGDVTIEAHFSEAVSNRLDIVATARTKGSMLFNSKPWSSWADVELAMDQWVEGIRSTIDKAHRKQ